MNEKWLVLSTFLIVAINLVIACFGIAVFAEYYTPGNPIRPRRIDVDVAGYLGIYIGASQALYLAPLLIYARRSQRWNLVKSVVLGAVITIVINVVFLFITSKK